MISRYKFLIITFSITVSFTALFYLQPNLKAQTEDVRGIVVSPPQIVKDVAAGTKFTEIFTVVNQRGQDENIYVTTRAIARDKNGEFFIPEGFEENSVSEFEKNGWINISQTEFSLPNGEKYEIPVTFTLPNEIKSQGYYLELVFSTVPSDTPYNGVGLTPEIAIPIAINYLGDEKETFLGKSIEVLSFDSDKDFYEFPIVNLQTHLINKGNLNIRPKGEIFISADKDFSNIIARLKFNEEGQLVLSDSGRKFSDPWEEGFLVVDNQGNLKVDFSQVGKFGLFQNYYAQLNVVWSQNGIDEFVTATTSFWIIPWRLILAIVVVIFAIVYIIRQRVRKNGSRK